MTTSGTWNYNINAGDAALQALNRCGIRRTEVTQEHLADAYQEANLLNVELTNLGCNLWTSELQTVSLVQGTATYNLLARTQDIQAAYLTTVYANQTNDVNLAAMSATDYAGINVKTTQGQPTSFWYNRLISPTITMWPVPDGTYTLNLRCFMQIQDTVLSSGTNLQMPYRYLDAYVSKLAARLAVIYAADKAQGLMAVADKAYALAAEADEEDVPIRIQPSTATYFM